MALLVNSMEENTSIIRRIFASLVDTESSPRHFLGTAFGPVIFHVSLHAASRNS